MAQTEQISSKEWEVVCELIQEVEQDQNREVEHDKNRVTFIKNLTEWQLATRFFRRIEMKRILLAEPDEKDLRLQAICLHALLTMGKALLSWSKDFPHQELRLLNIAPEDIAASVEALKLSLRERHHAFSESEIRHAQSVIFGGAA
ncbi:MAG: hypothetical protein M3463_09700 [Verrucomicrobiota bacterium]|nr:hypothetical protein [Verrucomicrobiota bacterium]